MMWLWLFNSVSGFSTLSTPALKPLWPLSELAPNGMFNLQVSANTTHCSVCFYTSSTFINIYWWFLEIGVPPNQSKSSIFMAVSLINHPFLGILHRKPPHFSVSLGAPRPTPNRREDPDIRRRRWDLPAAAARGKKPWGLGQTCWPLTRWRLVTYWSVPKHMPYRYTYIYIYIDTFYILHVCVYIYIYLHSNIYIHYIHTLYTYIYIHTLYTYIHAYIHYITLHYITLHYTTLHYITLHYTTLHYITLHYITLHYITLHYITLHTYIHTYIHTFIIYTCTYTYT